MSTIHLFIIGDTDCPNIGRSVQLDVARTIRQIQEYATTSEMWLNIRILTSHYYSPEHIKQCMREIHVGTDDVIFFYYSGHGFRTDEKVDPLPLLKFPTTIIDLIQNRLQGFDSRIIYETLQRKGARLLIFLTDSCQSKPNRGTNVIDHASYSQRSVEQRTLNCKRLFRETTGEVLLISCEPGQSSFGDSKYGYGGSFSYGIFTTLDDVLNRHQPAKWDTIAEEGSEKAYQLSRELYEGIQNAIWKCTHHDVFDDILEMETAVLDDWIFSRDKKSRSFDVNNQTWIDSAMQAAKSIPQQDKPATTYSSYNTPANHDYSVSKSLRESNKSSGTTCIKCHRELRSGVRFCVYCGTKQPS